MLIVALFFAFLAVAIALLGVAKSAAGRHNRSLQPEATEYCHGRFFIEHVPTNSPHPYTVYRSSVNSLKGVQRMFHCYSRAEAKRYIDWLIEMESRSN